MAKGKCACGPANFLLMVVAVIVMGVGLLLLIRGISAQWNATETWQMVLVFYALGLLIMSIGKMFKSKACSGCPVHSCMH